MNLVKNTMIALGFLVTLSSYAAANNYGDTTNQETSLSDIQCLYINKEDVTKLNVGDWKSGNKIPVEEHSGDKIQTKYSSFSKQLTIIVNNLATHLWSPADQYVTHTINGYSYVMCKVGSPDSEVGPSTAYLFYE